MPTTLDSFTKSSSIADTDRLVGYTNTNSGGERSWPFSALKNAVSTTVSPALVKAWVNFDGWFASSPFTTGSGIRASYNVSSVIDNGAGDYTVVFQTPLLDANYVVSCQSGSYSTNTSFNQNVAGDANGNPTLQTTSQLRVYYGGSDGVRRDNGNCHIIVTGT